MAFSSATQEFSFLYINMLHKNFLFYVQPKSALVLNLSRLMDVFLEGIPCVSNWLESKRVTSVIAFFRSKKRSFNFPFLVNIQNISVCKLLPPLEI